MTHALFCKQMDLEPEFNQDFRSSGYATLITDVLCIGVLVLTRAYTARSLQDITDSILMLVSLTTCTVTKIFQFLT